MHIGRHGHGSLSLGPRSRANDVIGVLSSSVTHGDFVDVILAERFTSGGKPGFERLPLHDARPLRIDECHPHFHRCKHRYCTGSVATIITNHILASPAG
jgi:hypothetical protein